MSLDRDAIDPHPDPPPLSQGRDRFSLARVDSLPCESGGGSGWGSRLLRHAPKAVFLDRDGVINANRDDYVKSVEEFSFLEGACDAIARLSEEGIPVFVVSNQSCVGRGLLDMMVLKDITDHLVTGVRTSGGDIAKVYYCPHRPDEGCECRKPRAGLLQRAAEEFGVDLSRSFLVGDAHTDIIAGNSVGCRTALVLTGRGQIELKECHQKNALPHHVASDLTAAVDWVLKEAPSFRR